MINKGKAIEKAVRESGMSVTLLAKKLNKSRGWIYNTFNSSKVPLDTILQIGNAIHYNFVNDFKELQQADSTIINKNDSFKITTENAWKDKYLLLLEEHNSLLKEYNKLLIKKK